MLSPVRITSLIFELKISLICDQLIYFSSKEHMSKFHWRKCYGHSLLDRMSFGLSKETHYLNLIRYYSVSIENTYCYQFPSIMTQSIGNIWSAYDLSRRPKSLLTLVQTQYSFKVKSPYSIVVWWIMVINSLMS